MTTRKTLHLKKPVIEAQPVPMHKGMPRNAAKTTTPAESQRPIKAKAAPYKPAKKRPSELPATARISEHMDEKFMARLRRRFNKGGKPSGNQA